MIELIADVKVFVSSLAARDTSFGGILSSPVDSRHPKVLVDVQPLYSLSPEK